jgi:exosortase E/protease (VPEID-CTERM system)
VRDAVTIAIGGTAGDEARCLGAAASRYAPEAFLGLLLLGEVLSLTIVFDTQSLYTIPTISAQIVNYSPQYLRLVSVTVVSALVLASARRPATLPALLSDRRPGPRVAPLLVHGSGLALFAASTATIVATGAAYQAHPALWTLAWLLTGSATLAGWALALWPVSTWRALLGHMSGSIGWGLAIGLAVLAAGYVTEEFWIPLARVTFGLVAWLLGFLYSDTVSQPARLVIGTPAFRVNISPQCSGYEGIGLMLAFLSVYLWWYRRELRFPAALLLLPLGAVVIWFANAVRIVALIAIGTAGWRTIATGGFHSQAGWIAFNAIALGFVALTNHFGNFRTTGAANSAGVPREGLSEEAGPTAAYLGPFFAITATAMLTGAFSAGFDWLYPLRVVAAGTVLWVCRRHYAGLTWSYSWWSFAVGFATCALWLALLPGETSRNAGWPAALQSAPTYWATPWMLLRVIGYVIAAPVAEELAFRGFLMRRIHRPDFQNLPIGTFSWLSFAISSVLFGAFHGSLWLPGTVAGMTFALALYRRRSLGDAVWAHATTNGLLALYAWATGEWWVWS